jgi:hypothetical protein
VIPQLRRERLNGGLERFEVFRRDGGQRLRTSVGWIRANGRIAQFKADVVADRVPTTVGEIFVVNDQRIQGLASSLKAARELPPVPTEQRGSDRMSRPAVEPTPAIVATGRERTKRVVGVADQEDKFRLRIEPPQKHGVIG